MEKTKEKSFACVSSFILKIIAFVTMTFDHVGALLQTTVGENYWLALTFRHVGRIALPLFCFMIAEGVIHSKKPRKYFLRLGIMASIISLALFLIVGVVNTLPEFNGSLSFLRNQGNIFIDLLLGAVAVYCLTNKRWYIKVLAVLPLLFGIASFVVTSYEFAKAPVLIHWFPYFLRPQYHFYGIGMIILFYLIHYVAALFIANYSQKSGLPVESVKGTKVERYTLNILSAGVVIIWTILFFVVSLAMPEDWVFWLPGVQNSAMIAGAFLLLYSGKRGYNAKWFQYGSYLYYPLHLIVIFGIGSLF